MSDKAKKLVNILDDFHIITKPSTVIIDDIVNNSTKLFQFFLVHSFEMLQKGNQIEQENYALIFLDLIGKLFVKMESPDIDREKKKDIRDVFHIYIYAILDQLKKVISGVWLVEKFLKIIKYLMNNFILKNVVMVEQVFKGTYDISLVGPKFYGKEFKSLHDVYRHEKKTLEHLLKLLDSVNAPEETQPDQVHHSKYMEFISNWSKSAVATTRTSTTTKVDHREKRAATSGTLFTRPIRPRTPPSPPFQEERLQKLLHHHYNSKSNDNVDPVII